MRLLAVTIVIFSLMTSSVLSAPTDDVLRADKQFVVRLADGFNESALDIKDVRNAVRIFSHHSLGSWYRIISRLDVNQLRDGLSGKITELQPNFQLKASAVVYNDPWFTNDKENTEKQWGLVSGGFTESWHKTTGSTDVVVAVIDTGLDATHEDLSGSNILPTYDVETRRELPAKIDSDENGHGTLVTGIIAAAAGNGKGIVGAAHGASILPIRALDSEGNGTSSSVSAGIVWATDNGADVINLSLGGLGFAHDVLLSNSIEYAYRKGVVVVSAAGNDAAITGGSLDENPVFPICNDNGENMVLGVTAVDFQGLKPNFANFGKACVDVSAPGRRIISTINHDPITGSLAPDSYAYASGTSLAVPFVSSQAALLKSLYKDATPRQIADRITSTAESIDKLNLSQCGDFSCSGLIGAGRIRVQESLIQPILPKVANGDLVSDENNNIYAIVGGKKRPVVPFILSQRFSGKIISAVKSQELHSFSEGPPLEPLDGTLIKRPGDETVYYVEKGIRLPVTYQIFLQHGFEFPQIIVMDTSVVISWVLGSFLPPKEGTLVKSGAKTVYWSVGGSLHPINYNFWKDRGLDIFPIMRVSDDDLKSFPIGDEYVR